MRFEQAGSAMYSGPSSGSDSGPGRSGIAADLRPHAYDPASHPELFEGVLTPVDAHQSLRHARIAPVFRASQRRGVSARAARGKPARLAMMMVRSGIRLMAASNRKPERAALAIRARYLKFTAR